MIELTSVLQQTIASNQAVQWNNVALKTGCAERHREGSAIITITKPGIYLVTTNMDVALPTGAAVTPITVALSVDGEALNGSVMTSTPDGTADFNNISTSHLVQVYCPCCLNVSVVNTSIGDVVFQNANITVERKA